MNTEWAYELLRKHRSTGAILDSNLLLLLLIGTFDRARIERSGRTRAFSPDDFDLLCRVMKVAERRITTPHIMAEVDNLGRSAVSQLERPALAKTFKRLCDEQLEIFREATLTHQDPLYPSMGITDCTLIFLARQKHLVVTADYPLAQRIEHEGLAVINFNHIRSLP